MRADADLLGPVRRPDPELDAPSSDLRHFGLACDTPAGYRAFLRYGEQLFSDAGLATFFDEYVVPRVDLDVKQLLDHVGPDTLIVANSLSRQAPCSCR